MSQKIKMRKLREVIGLAIFLMIFGISFHAQTQEPSQGEGGTPPEQVASDELDIFSLPGSATTEDQYQMFKVFFYDSLNTVIETLGSEVVDQSLNEFQGRDRKSLNNICPALIDYLELYWVLLTAFNLDFKGDVIYFLSVRLAADVSGIDVKNNPIVKKEHITRAQNDVITGVTGKLNRMSEKRNFCFQVVTSGVVMEKDAISTFLDEEDWTMTSEDNYTGYSSSEITEKMTTLYLSFASFIGWVQREITKGSSDEVKLKKIVEYIQIKYKITLLAQ